MSQEATIMFRLEQQHREELFRERVRNKTQEFYLRYRKQYEDMLATGYLQCIPEELRRFEQDLQTIENLLQSDPEAAREVSREVGNYVHGLWALAKEAMQTFRETARLERDREKVEQEKQRDEIFSRYYEVLSTLDCVTGNFAAKDFKSIEADISSGNISSVAELNAKLQIIISAAKQRAQEWKAQKQREQNRQVVAAQIEEQRKSIQAEKFEDASTVQALLKKLADVERQSIAGNISSTEAQKQLSAVANETDEALTDEDVRREMVKAIFKWFNEHDFTVSKPRRSVDGEVVLSAKRPSGNRAQFRLTADNKMFYRLDGYDGQNCLKDIAAAKADWESVYGLKLSNEVVSWQNPDRILRKQTRTVNSKGGSM